MTVTFVGTFSKRRNSTLRPSGGTAKTVLLKEGTSMMKPAFLLSSVSYNWNYCVWDDRYYYITDIVSESNTLFRVECELDVLATYKNYIGNYTTLISRAASDQDYDVVDSIYPAKTVPITKRVSISNPGVFTTDFKSGTFLIGTSGRNGQTVYVCSWAQATAAMTALFPQLSVTFNAWLDSTFNTAVMGGSSNATQYITFLKWIPVPFSATSALTPSSNEFYVGSWNLCDGVILSGPIHFIQNQINYGIYSQTVTFPARDDNGSRGKWEYLAPFANYSVYCPPFGLIPLDAAYLISSGRSVTFDLMVEFLSGNATLRVYYGIGQSGPKMAGVYTHNLACDLRQAGSSVNIGGIAGGAAAAVAGYMTEDYKAMVSGIASAASSTMPATGSVGGGGSGPTADMGETWYAYATYFEPIDENQAELGRPLAEVVAINSLSGFVKCANAQISIPGHAEEMSEVNGYLNSGFFYE